MADSKKSRSVKRADAEAAADRIARRYDGRDASRLLRFVGEKAEAQHAADQLRAAIEASELSDYELARRAGVAQSALSRFMTGERSLSLETFEKVCVALELEVVLKRRRAVRDK
jgi:DNA-binding Xre family transcriptional regulator